ncbi:hypothetical protein Ddye_026584 [Dipteronia dyeriana]|uniref:DUF1985 domain-containing protein n=1 Tax=Dipteronia dyeriana TaxID=168575 RepID=A0AAD9WPC4_9ROSI|nr:hypothetical protein Ddye_026584 [Dipteronia dyeriana]
MRNQLKELLKTLEEEWYEGKLTRHDHFDAIGVIDDALDQVPAEIDVEDRRQFMASCFGHFMKMHRSMKFSDGVIHRLLLREVHHTRASDGMYFMLGNQEEGFLKVEFYMIAGLRFREISDTSWYDSVDIGIHERYFVGKDEISFEELRDVLSLSQFQQAYDSVKLCLMYMMNWILMGFDERVKIPVWQFRLVKDLDAFDVFPWGAYVYSHSIFSFKHVLDGRREWLEKHQQAKGTDLYMLEAYNIYGLSYALMLVGDTGGRDGYDLGCLDILLEITHKEMLEGSASARDRDWRHSHVEGTNPDSVGQMLGTGPETHGTGTGVTG